MAKEVLIPKKWIWDGSCTYSSKYDLLSKYFIKQPATAGTEGQVLALNSDLEPVWTDEGELPAPGTEGQVLALNSSLEAVWQDDKTTTVFHKDDVSSNYDYKGDVFVPSYTTGSFTQGTVHYMSQFVSDVPRFLPITSLTTESQMTGMVGVTFSTSPSDGVLIRGIIDVGYSVGIGTSGVPIFIGGSGQITTVAPTGAGEYVRAIGYKIADQVVFFDPSQDNIELN
jgi:hypothetical protein|tara:strand:- start:480 stop:1157 length:678 start_codon:yes stop_codon:yes gene_type:complete